MIRALIFDFDGVILESADLKTKAFEQIAREEFPGFVEEIVAYHRRNMGISRFVKFRYIFDTLLKKKMTPKIEKRLGDRFTEIIFESLKTVPFVPGSLEFLEAAFGKYRMFVASGTPERELRKVADLRGVTKYFDELHGSPRTKKDIVLDIMARYRFTPGEVLFVGDAESDYLAAKLTGVEFVGRVHDDQLAGCECRQIPDLYHLEKFLPMR
jgi:phosphoglycolate phosphatase-like HAD superfamily hydrolase